MEHAFRQVLDVLYAVRDAAPKEHAHLLRVVFAAQHVHNLLGILAAAGVSLDVELTMPLVAVAVSLGSGKLYAAEGAALDVRLDLQNPLNELGIRGTETDAPAGHVVTLRHRVELNAAVLGTRYLEDAQVLLAEDERVGIVVDDDDAVLTCEAHQTLVGLAAGAATCRHVGIVGPHQFHTREVHPLQFVEVGLPTVVLAQVVVHNLRTENLRERRVSGIAGIGHQHLVAGIDEGQRDVQDALLRADERQNLGFRVEVDVVPALVESGHRRAQLGRTHRGLVAVGCWVVGHLAELFNRLL